MAEAFALPRRRGAYDPAPDLTIAEIDPTLYNRDLAPVAAAKRSWGWFEIFNVWSNAVQSLFGYTPEQCQEKWEPVFRPTLRE
jgi:hypothetical protein